MSEGFRQHSYQPPEGATEVILVRHGESRAASKENPFPLVDGHGDPELHPNGEQQAIAVGERLKDEKIDAIYVTSLQRTVQTAAPLAAHLGMSMRVEADLREVCLGRMGRRRTAHESSSRRPDISKNAGGRALGRNTRRRELGDAQCQNYRGAGEDP